MNDLYDQRKILADGSIIQLLPYVPKRFNSGDVDDSLKSGSNDTLPDSFVIEGLEGKGRAKAIQSCSPECHVRSNEQSLC